MMWMAWRQFRTQAAVVAGALAAIAIVLAVTGPGLVHLYDTTVATCARHNDCSVAAAQFLKSDRLLQNVSDLVLIAPALIGVFWGAPLIARELENGTYKLDWTQSISRRRWLTGKLLVVGAASVISAGVLSLMVTWWSSPLDRVNDTPFAPSFFDRRDLVPIGYAAFAFALGVVLGALVRRTLPAMATTVVGYVGLRAAEFAWIRPHLQVPLHATIPLDTNPSGAGIGTLNRADWILSNQTLNRAGHVIGQNGGVGSNGAIGLSVSARGVLHLQGIGTCPNKVPILKSGGFRGQPSSGPLGRAVSQCTHDLGLREVLTLQPIQRYWPFQWIELGVFIVLALALIALTFWLLRRA